MLYLLTNTEKSKGIIIDAADVDAAKKAGNREYYLPFKNLNDLNTIQPYNSNKNMFWSVNGKQNFKKVQFHFSGENGAGVVTSYNCNIDIQPNDDQSRL